MSKIKGHLLQALSSIAWNEAVNPNSAANIRASLGSTSEPQTYASVEESFDTETAVLWQEAKDLRERYFKSATMAIEDKEPELSQAEQTLKKLIELRNSHKDPEDYKVLDNTIEILKNHSDIKARRETALDWLANNQ